MPVLWKALLGMLLTLPAGAYVAGTIVGPYDTAQPPRQSAPSVSGSPTAPSRDPAPAPAYVGPTEAPAQPLDTAAPAETGQESRRSTGPEARSDHDRDTVGPRLGARGGDLESESPTESVSPTDGTSESPTPTETVSPTDGTTTEEPSGTPTESDTESTSGSTGTSSGSPSSDEPPTPDPYAG